jgi:hypothetical protein
MGVIRRLLNPELPAAIGTGQSRNAVYIPWLVLVASRCARPERLWQEAPHRAAHRVLRWWWHVHCSFSAHFPHPQRGGANASQCAPFTDLGLSDPIVHYMAFFGTGRGAADFALEIPISMG